MTLVLKPTEIYAKRMSEDRLGAIAIADGWNTRPLGELIELLNGAPFDSNLFNRDGKGKPLIRIRDVGKDDTETWFNGEFDSKYLVAPGDVLVGLDGDFRVAEWHGTEALLNQRVCKLIPREDLLNKRFLLYHLAGWLDAIWEETSATTVKHLSSKTIQEIPFPTPPLEEQKRIVEALDAHLSRLDKALSDVSAGQDRLEALKKAYLHQVLNAAGETSKLSDLCSLITDGSHFSPKTENQGYPYITVRDISGDEIDFDGCKYISQQSFDELDKNGCRPEVDDVLFSKDGTVGKVAIVSTQRPFVVLSSLAILRPNPTKIIPSFLKLALKSPMVLESALGMKTGTAIRRVVLRNLKNLEIDVPSLATQEEIVSKVERQLDYFRTIEGILRSQVVRIQELRRSLLNAAFSGQL